jgi:predicted flavoprotein YhiN
VLRAAIEASGDAVIHIALRPDLAVADLAERLDAPRAKQSLSTFLRKTVKLSPVAIGLLHEATHASPGRLAAMDPAALAGLINALPLRLVATAPLATAISTAGGIAFAELDPSFMLRRRPGVFVAGEMLDWEAPTGGYLLQASFATGAAAGRGALQWLERSDRTVIPKESGAQTP